MTEISHYDEAWTGPMPEIRDGKVVREPCVDHGFKDCAICQADADVYREQWGAGEPDLTGPLSWPGRVLAWIVTRVVGPPA
jgi:hypothetical protein